jgi:hypothetical protein
MGEGCAGLPDSRPGTAPAPAVTLVVPIKSAKMPTTMTTPSIPIQKRVVISLIFSYRIFSDRVVAGFRL